MGFIWDNKEGDLLIPRIKWDAAVMHMSWPTIQKRNMQIRLLASDSECRVIFAILHAWQSKPTAHEIRMLLLKDRYH